MSNSDIKLDEASAVGVEARILDKADFVFDGTDAQIVVDLEIRTYPRKTKKTVHLKVPSSFASMAQDILDTMVKDKKVVIKFSACRVGVSSTVDKKIQIKDLIGCKVFVAGKGLEVHDCFPC